MDRRFVARAWRSLRGSRGWIARMCLLALVSFVPVFGGIVVLGYLYGWAREAAWGLEKSLPRRVFGNEDGLLYRRGWFAFVISVVETSVSGLAAFALFSVLVSISGFAASFVALTPGMAFATIMAFLALAVVLAAAACVVQLFVWTGTMRMSLYDTLSSGFQLRRCASMLKHDAPGIARILLMWVVAGLAAGLIVGMLWCVVAFVCVLAMAVAADAGSMVSYGGLAVLGSVATLVFACSLAYLSVVASVTIEAVTCRALGYWTAQFDVARWGSQGDPMPFELMEGSAQHGPSR